MHNNTANSGLMRALSTRVLSTRKLLLTGVFLLGLAVLTGCGGDGEGNAGAQARETEDAGEEAVPVEVAEVTRRAVAASYTGTAPLEARGEAQVIAKTSGVALEVLVELGQQVRAGEPLVKLDPDRARLAVAQAEAEMRKLENNYNRSRQLVAQQLISASDVDQIKYDLENVSAQYRLARLELSYTTVTAPISGVIAQVSIKPGNFVQINTPIMRIVDTSRLEATLNVPERELATMEVGLPVSLQVDALPGRNFTGVIDRVAPVVDAGSGTFRVVVAFEGDSDAEQGDRLQPARLQPGMFGRISIGYDQRADALVVPRAALLEGDDDAAVFRVRDDKVARVAVQLGYLDGQWAEIRDGLEFGDRVVTAGKTALRDGTMVQIVGEPAATQTATTGEPDSASGSRQ